MLLNNGDVYSSGAGGYRIARSLRFNAADSAYLNLTPAAGTRDKWKLRVNLKRANLGITATIISADTTSDDRIYFNASNKLCWDFAGTNRLVSTAVFRDPTAWGIWEFIYDAANGTANQKARVFYNGVEITAWDTDTRSSITTSTSKINTNVTHNIGRRANGATDFFDGYMSDFALIDNDATSGFSGALDATTGAFNPIAPVSAKWWLKWEDNSNTTAETLGKDSGSDNAGWTCNNFSVAAGAGNDSLTDTPTNYGTDTGAGGEVRGNYCTINPLANYVSLANGNLDASTTVSGTENSVCATQFVQSGKWYAEALIGGTSITGIGVGVTPIAPLASSTRFSEASGGGGTAYQNSGNKEINGSSTAYGASFAATNLIGIALDMDAATPTVTFYKDNVSQGTINLTAGRAYAFACYLRGNTATVTWNFGQRPFAYTAPSGFKALCTQNLPDPAVVRADDYFTVHGRAGTGVAGSVTDKRFQPDLIWSKSRSARSHMLADSVRGVQKYFSSDAITDETSDAQAVTAFNSGGFSFGTSGILNTNAENFIDWLWRKGSTPGFDVVTYTGNGSNRTISHAVGAAPSLVIVKARTTASTDIAAQVWHSGIANTEYLVLNTTAAKATGATRWNSTTPTSSVFSLGTAAETNANSDTFVAYLFAEVPGFSRIASYTGNGSADGPFVWCGFRPAFVMIKRADSTGDWFMWDAARDPYNARAKELLANTNAAEASTDDIDFLSNGFKLRATTAGFNASGGTYCFVAFAEHPAKFARAA